MGRQGLVVQGYRLSFLCHTLSWLHLLYRLAKQLRQSDRRLSGLGLIGQRFLGRNESSEQNTGVASGKGNRWLNWLRGAGPAGKNVSSYVAASNLMRFEDVEVAV